MIKVNNYKELKDLFKAKNELIIHHYLEEDIECINFEEGQIELRLSPIVPHDVPRVMSCLLKDWTGLRWVLILTPRDKIEESILQEAERILKEREDEYSDESLKFTAILWARYLEELCGDWIPLEANHVAIMMILMNISKITCGKDKRDNYVDIASYTALAAEL